MGERRRDPERALEESSVAAIVPPRHPQSPAAEAKRAAGAPPEEPAPLAPSGGDPFPVPAYRRDVLDDIGPFDPRMPRAQDVELGLRFS